MPAEFNPNKTHISASSLATWLASPVTDDIKQVPGIAGGNAEKLAENGVHTTYQLLGVFLSLKGPEVGSVELCERFYQTLKSYGIQAKRGEIVVAIAEKLNNVYPNLYRPEMYDE